MTSIAHVETGTVVGGYRIDAIAGQGGMGVVYRATQLGLDRLVALKLISAELAGDAAFRSRFDSEAQLAASIDHPNVVPVHGVEEADARAGRWTALAELSGERPLLAGAPTGAG